MLHIRHSRTFSVCQLPSGRWVCTDREPSEEAAATIKPSSCGAKATLLTLDVWHCASYTCHGQACKHYELVSP